MIHFRSRHFSRGRPCGLIHTMQHCSILCRRHSMRFRPQHKQKNIFVINWDITAWRISVASAGKLSCPLTSISGVRRGANPAHSILSCRRRPTSKLSQPRAATQMEMCPRNATPPGKIIMTNLGGLTRDLTCTNWPRWERRSSWLLEMRLYGGRMLGQGRICWPTIEPAVRTLTGSARSVVRVRPTPVQKKWETCRRCYKTPSMLLLMYVICLI